VLRYWAEAGVREADRSTSSADLEKNQLSPAFTAGRETRKYWDNLDGPLKAARAIPDC
jgi:hypothetical protein